MNSKPLVSVVIIFFNAERLIGEAIGSVFAQTYDNWELLLVDDGSTDRSSQTAIEYAEKHPEKVRYLQHNGHQNLGKSTSRNFGIINANGDYIAFLDADDIFLPQKLERQVEILNSQPDAAMVYGPTLYWHSWTGNYKDKQKDYVPELGIQPNVLVQPPKLLKLFFEYGSIPCTCSLLLRRNVIEKVGGFEENIQQLYEDQVFLAKIFTKTPVFVESGCWALYRQHQNSTYSLSIRNGEDSSARQTFVSWLERYLFEQGVKDAEILRGLQQAQWPYRHPVSYHLLLKHLLYVRRWIRGFYMKWIRHETLSLKQ